MCSAGLAGFGIAARWRQKPVDDVREGLHNLASLLLKQQRKTVSWVVMTASG
jgi:hypothetical protein